MGENSYVNPVQTGIFSLLSTGAVGTSHMIQIYPAIKITENTEPLIISNI